MNNETDIGIRFTNKVTGETKLEKYAESLSKIRAAMAGFNSGQLTKIEQTTKSINQQESILEANNTKLAKGFKTAFNTASIIAFGKGLSKVYKTMVRLTTKSSDFLENFNLFQVAFDGSYQSAEKFVNQMTEMYGLDESWAIRTVGIFKQLSNAMNLSVEQGTKLSTLLTQMSVDISSLYNVDIEKASSVLQSALAGQTKPIRGTTGADITQATLQTTLGNLGIDRYVSDLSYAEKRLLIIISLTRQLSEATGDFGRTIESPANQMRILSEQFSRLGRAVGNVFLPILAKILPYLNAIVMVLTEIVSAIAKLFGYKDEDYDYFAGTAESVIELEDGLEGANEAAQKLKHGLRGFDKLNVITTPTSSNAKISGGAGGIDPSIMNAFNDAFDDYNKKLEHVQMKATKIRDSIMEWLGFTKIIDEETGKVSFKFDHITAGTVLGALGVGGAIFLGIKKIYNLIKAISGFKFSGVTKLIGSLTGAKGAGSVAKDTANSVTGFKVPDVKTVLKGLADLTLIVGGTVALIEAIGLLTKIPGFKETATEGIKELKEVFLGIGSIALPLTYVSALVGIMGTIGVAEFAKGLADLAIVISGTSILITAIGALMSIPSFSDFLSTGIESVTKLFNGLWEIALPLGVLSAGIVVLGFVNPSVLAMGIAGFAIVVVGLEAVLIALGALMEIPHVKELASSGAEVLIGIGDTLGKFAGSLVNGFLSIAFDSLGEIGTHLSEFMENASPFFEKLGGISETSTAAIRNLAACILELTAANVLDGLTSWFTGGTSFVKFGQQLAEFAPYLVDYSKVISGNIDEEALVASANAAKMLAEMAKELPNSGGLAGLFAGENDLDEFGAMLPEFGKNLKSYSDNIKGIDAEAVTASANAAKSIAEFAQELPNQGGVVSWFTGDNTLEDFSEILPNFGKNLKSYSDNIKGINNDLIKSTSEAAGSIAEFAKKLPNKGGVVSWFTGDNTLEDFSEILPDFGKNLKKYSQNIAGIDIAVVDNTTKAATSIAELADNLPNQGGIVAWFTGDNKLSDFGYELSQFGKYFKEYFNTIKNIGADKVNQITSSIEKIIDNFIKVKSNGINETITNFGKALSGASSNIKSFFTSAFNNDDAWSFGYSFGKSFSNGLSYALRNSSFPTIKLSSEGETFKSFKINAYAGSGLPPVGQIFVANEKGPELVGNLGGQSFVANQNAVVDLMDKKLGQAQTRQPQIYNIYLDKEHKLATYTLDQLQDMAISNGKPITLGA